jgi:hypothetical protein
MIELTKIAAMAGIGGLFQIKTPLKNGVMMESLDEKKTKIVAGATNKVSILSEISIYTTTADGSVSLESVLKSLHEKYGPMLPANSKSDGADLKNVLKSVLPEVDLDRVYVSDIKKLVTWYGILVTQVPELFVKKVEEKTKEEVASEKPAEEKPAKKAKAAKAEKPANEAEAEEPKPKKAAAKKK